MLRRVSKKQGLDYDFIESSMENEFVDEYYDEDDEGYEPEDGVSSKAQIYASAVGGSGSNLNPKAGFFFRDDVNDEVVENVPRKVKKKVRKDVNLSKEERGYKARLAEKEKKIQKSTKPKVAPLLDGNGKEQYFTLAKAEQQTRDLLTESGIEENSQQTFEDLGITNPFLLQNLDIMGCSSPLPVQTKSCLSIIQGKDVLVGTHTGSGKTLAFLVPLAESLLSTESESKTSSVRAIIVAPGRELASQIISVARELFQGTGLNVALAIGGTPFSRNVERIRKSKPDIIIGTPGRIAELVVGKDGER